jgi:predicted AAA+ superfamily ATPase
MLNPSAITEGSRLFVEFKGALSENYILQSLSGQFEGDLRYWAQDNPHNEVDFLAQYDNEIIPIEVKAGANTESPSLKKYRALYKPKVALRFSLRNLHLDKTADGTLINIPLFLADQTGRLLKDAFT